MEIAITTSVDAETRAVVTVAGSLDLQTRDALREAGQAALADASAGALVLDLAGVTFIDSTGIGAIVGLAGDAADIGRAFSLRNPSPRVTRILTVTGLINEWSVDTSNS
jgi:anti-sigma B factor antagonist